MWLARGMIREAEGVRGARGTAFGPFTACCVHNPPLAEPSLAPVSHSGAAQTDTRLPIFSGRFCRMRPTATASITHNAREHLSRIFA